MVIFINLLKKIVITLGCIAVLLSIAMFSLNKQNFIVSNDTIQKIIQYCDTDLVVETQGAELKFIASEVQINIPKVKLTRDKDHYITLQNFNLSFNILKLGGLLEMQISNSEVMSLIYVKNKPEVMSVVDNIMSHNYLICDGRVVTNFGLFQVNQTILQLSGKRGWNDPKKDGLSRIDLKKFNLELIYQTNKVSIKNLQLEYINNLKASFSGDFNFSFGNLVLADFKTEISQFPIDYLDGFWPSDIFPQLQNWVTSNVSKGVVTKAQGKFQLTEDDFKTDLPRKESVDVVLELGNMEVNYLEQYNPISKINGILRINGHGLNLEVQTAETAGVQLKSIELELPFDNFILSLKTKIDGDIAKFNQFISKELFLDLLNYNIDFSLIKGNLNGVFNLGLPIFEEFKLNNLKLDFLAEVNNVILDKNGIIAFKKGSFEILNENSKIKVKLLGENNILLEFDIQHDLNLKHENQINIATEINTKDRIVFQDKISFNNGVIRPKINLIGNTWSVDVNLTDAEIAFLPLGYIKPKSVDASIKCSGEIKDNLITSKSCNLSGKQFAGDISFRYSVIDSVLTKLELNNIKLGDSNFSVITSYDKNIYNYKLLAKYLDLTNYSSDAISSRNEDQSNYNISFKIDKMIMPNKNYLHDVTGKTSKIGKNPIEIDFKAFANNEQISIIKIKKNSQDGYLLHSESAATFAQDFGIYKNIKKGEIWIEGYPKETEGDISYYGTLKLEKFALTNTSAFAKIILGVLSITSPEALKQTLQGGSLKADSFNANWNYNNGILEIKNAVIIGSSYDIKFAGNINYKDKTVNIKGVCIPSVFGINTFVSNLPLFGTILSGGKDSAFIGSNFSVKGDVKDPKVSFSTLSSLTPGFIRNLFSD